MEPTKQKEDHSQAYDITRYDRVFILLHPLSEKIKEHADKVHYDKSKNRYYLSGRIIRYKYADVPRSNYPVYHSIAFVNEPDVSNYLKETDTRKKTSYILNVFYAEIEFITLDFNSYDWKK